MVWEQLPAMLDHSHCHVSQVAVGHFHSDGHFPFASKLRTLLSYEQRRLFLSTSLKPSDPERHVLNTLTELRCMLPYPGRLTMYPGGRCYRRLYVRGIVRRLRTSSLLDLVPRLAFLPGGIVMEECVVHVSTLPAAFRSVIFRHLVHRLERKFT